MESLGQVKESGITNIERGILNNEGRLARVSHLAVRQVVPRSGRKSLVNGAETVDSHLLI